MKAHPNHVYKNYLYYSDYITVNCLHKSSRIDQFRVQVSDVPIYII